MITVPTRRPRPEAVDLLRRTLEWITAHPEVHNQATWLCPASASTPSGEVRVDVERPTACGTTGCLAGHAVLLSGRYPVRVTHREMYYVPGNPGPVVGFVEVYVDGRWRDVDTEIQVLAELLLDLSVDQGEALFAADRTLGELWVLAQRYTDGQVVPPPNVVTETDREILEWCDDDE